MILSAFILFPRLDKLPLSHLEQIQKNKIIKFVTYNSASTYYQNSYGYDGFEYQLAKGFAEYIDVEAKFITVQNFSEMQNKVIFNDVDIAAAGLSDLITESEYVQFGPRYYHVIPQVIYKKGAPQYKSINEFGNTHLEAPNNSSNIALLDQLSDKTYINLNWTELDDIAVEEAIEMVNEGFIQYLIVDSHNFALQRRFFPELRISFELAQKKPLKWMLKKSADNSLIDETHDYFQTIKEDGRLDQWIHRYLSHVEKFNYSDIQTFEKMLKKRLPKYQTIFMQEAEENNMDWRLLAAIGYQESLWNPKAKSPTGVRGLMMLTKVTAKQMGIKNRLDPFQSIKGGAKYIARVMRKIPERIEQPDRTWLALASYNVGYGHVEDARKITQIRGADADKWVDVKKSLPLLSRKKWYKKTKYGYARGAEPVKYVENIRKYYDLLVWHSNQNKKEAEKVEKEPEESITLPISPSL